MEKDKFIELSARRTRGERIRVVFDILMDLIEAQPGIEKAEFWEKIKNGYEDEIKAFEELTRIPNKVKKSRKPRRKKEDPPIENFLNEDLIDRLEDSIKGTNNAMRLSEDERTYYKVREGEN